MRYAYVVVSLCLFFWFVVWFQRMSFPPLAPVIRDEFGLTYTQIALVITLPIIVSGVAYIVVGYLSERHDVKKILLAALLIGIFGSLMTGLSVDYPQLVISQAILTISESFIFIPTVVLLAVWFKREDRGKVIGIFESGLYLGSFTIFVAAAPVNQLMGWRWVFYLGAVLGLAALLLAWRFIHLQRKPKAGKVEVRRIVTDRDVLVNAVALMLIFMNWYGVYAFAPTYLVDVKGFDISLAGIIGGAAIGIGVLASPANGLLADRLGPKNVGLIFIPIYVVMLYSFGLVVDVWMTVVTLLILGFALNASYLSLFAILLKETPESLGLTFGIVLAVGALGGGLGPLILGYVADIASFDVGFILMMMLAVISWLILLTRKKRV